MKVKLIAAIGNQNQLGKDNKLLWHIPKDLELFKKLTSSSPIIMGRKTFESLPGILPNREHIVITGNFDIPKHSLVTYVSSIHVAIDLLSSKEKDECWIIGGGEIYKQALEQNLVDELHISHVNYSGDADTFFPEIDYSKWELQAHLKHESFNKEPVFAYKKYTRITNENKI